jgi:acetyl esterase/lipase
MGATTEIPAHVEGTPVPAIDVHPTVAEMTYAGARGRSRTLDLYLPSAPGQHPVLIYFQGGGWRSGSKREIKRFVFEQVARGFALVSVGYTLSGEGGWPIQGREAKAAVRWVRANARRYGLAADRLVAVGNSAGGHIAAFIGVGGETEADPELDRCNSEQVSTVHGVVSWYGVYDFRALVTPDRDNPVTQLLKVTTAQYAAAARQASPITYVKAGLPPFYLLHGDADTVVAPRQSADFFAALRTAGTDAVLETFPHFHHGDPRFDTPEARRGFETFLDRFRKR